MNTTVNTLTVNEINDWSKVPGSNTYFRTSDVTPYVEGETLNVYDAKGDRRSWGQPSVSSDVEKLSDSVVKVHVVGWHKWTVSPVGGNFYFVNENGKWTRRTANHKAVKAVLSN